MILGFYGPSKQHRHNYHQFEHLALLCTKAEMTKNVEELENKGGTNGGHSKNLLIDLKLNTMIKLETTYSSSLN